MNISAVSTPSAAALQNLLQGRYQDYNELQNALQSGNIANAQRAFAAFEQDAQKSAQLSGSTSIFAAGTQTIRDLQSLGSALRAADLNGAQKAFATLAQDISSAGGSSQLIDSTALNHAAKVFGGNATLNGSAKAAGTVLNQKA